MRFTTKVKIAAVSVVAVAAVGTVVVVRRTLRKRREKREMSFMTDEVRTALEELCSYKGEDFIPDKLGTSRYQRKLSSLTDRQLIGVYVMIKLGEVLRDRGLDFRQLSKQEIMTEALQLHRSAHQRGGRQDLIHTLGSIGAETARSMLGDGLMLAGMALQTA